MDENEKKAEEAIERAKKDLEEAVEALHEGDQAPPVQPQEQPPVQPAPAVPQSPPAQPAAPTPEPAPVQPASQEAPPVQPAPVAPAQEAPAAAPASGKWRVEYERDNCIGAGACVAANADFWSIDQDGKATLKSATFDQARNLWVLDLDDDQQLQKQRDAAGVCPVNVIHIVDPSGNREI